MSAHRPGTSLPNQSTHLRDRTAMARAGVTVREDHDQGENYDGEDVLFPVESRVELGGKQVVGTCPDDGFATVIDGNGLGGTCCVYCGRQLTGRWAQ